MEIEELYRIYLQHPEISTDTRTVKPNGLFFALRGEQYDANRFAAEALQKGAAFSIIDNPDCSGQGTILVDNVLQSLQQLAAMHRKTLTVPVIGITGSNGKTTTKELIHAVLSRKYTTSATQGNLNNHIGVPLTILAVPGNAQMVIVEMGANHIGEIESLCLIAQPTHGIITNIGKAHLEGFGGFQGVIAAKSELYKSLRNTRGTAFVNRDDTLLMQLTETISRIEYGVSDGRSEGGRLADNTLFLELEWLEQGRRFPVKTQLVGRYNFTNVMAALTIGTTFGVEPEQCVKAVEEYQPKNNRSEYYRTDRNTIILDAYNANPSSMEAAILNFHALTIHPKMVLLGGMKELGADSSKEHRAIIDLVSELNFSEVLFAGPEFFECAREKGFKAFKDAAGLFDWLKEQNISGYSILVKGSRGSAMETVLPAL